MNNPIFIGHGSPMNIIAQNQYTKFLTDYALSIPQPKAVVVISAHWQTNGTFITGDSNPEQIFDFYGFPDELYNIKYTPQGLPELAEFITKNNTNIQIDYDRGIDHAGWSIMQHMYPAQNIPLLQMSLDINKSEQQHFLLGQELIKFLDKDILFIGSGNIIHNLRQRSAKPLEWAIEADNWFKDKINNYSIDKLINYKLHLNNYQQAIPTDEHYLPLLYILGMKQEHQGIKTIYEEIQDGNISMRSFEID